MRGKGEEEEGAGVFQFLGRQIYIQQPAPQMWLLYMSGYTVTWQVAPQTFPMGHVRQLLPYPLKYNVQCVQVCVAHVHEFCVEELHSCIFFDQQGNPTKI